MEIRLLGPTTVVGVAGAVRPGAPKQRQILALLALRPGKVVGMDRIVDELWGAEPPRSALAAVQTYVYQLRKLIRGCLARPTEKDVLATVDPGYVLRVPEESVDVFRFRNSLRKAGELNAAASSTASVLVAHALDMLDGPPLADVRRGAVLQGDAASLDEQLLSANRLTVCLDMRLGRYEAVIARLRTLVTEYPFVESFQVDLVASLYRSGRRSDAIGMYHEFRARLRDELGVEPSRAAQELYLEMISCGRSSPTA